ncbi:tetratricopeptide repeat protein [Pseudoalteromonas aliena]|uniref:tetratricopeptide repeat protein n=1 Tax=Pseudoalteromonas aliena TaxID=247523 RepID=UPI00249427CD|nr:tetratricopeptide repeat protein [Pseudoalteromonas aliena]
MDEKLQQQKTLGNDVKTLEAAQQALTIQLSRFQAQLEAQDKLQASQFTGFDGRIGDLKDSINWWFSILTIFLALGGLLIYKLSRKEAENVAHQQMEGFISSNADEILANAQVSLEKQLGEANTSVEDLKKYIDEAHEIIEEKKKEVEAAAEDVQKSIAEKKEPNPESLRILENSTKKISKEHTTAREYLNLANVGYGKKNYKETLKYLNLAIKTLKDSEKQTRFHAQLLWNIAIAHSMLQDVNAELKAYDELIENFKSIHNEDSWGFVARAMLNQGVVYAKQEKFEDALNSYSTLIEQFKGSSNEEIQIQVAMAMLNQGNTYDQQEKFEEEFNSYTRVIEQFKDSSIEEIQVLIAKAMVNQISIYSRQKDFSTAKNIHSTLIQQFNSSEKSEIKIQIGYSLANIAELALLFETPEQVLCRVTEVEEFITDQQILAVMQFIRFLLNDKTIEEVFAALAAIPAEMKLKWSFREIKDYLANFEGEKLHQIQAVVSFFEQYKDIEKLRIELGLKS